MSDDERAVAAASEERKARGSRIEVMAAATATIVSLASLYLAVRQTSVAERQLEAQVWPSLFYDTGDGTEDGKPTVTFSVKNGGVGPARVRSLEVSYGGKPMAGGVALLTACCGLADDHDAYGSIDMTILNGRIVGPGQEVAFLKLAQPKAGDAVWEKLEDVRFAVDGRVCFCSALDQCWTVGFHESEPAPVRDCATEAKRAQYTN